MKIFLFFCVVSFFELSFAQNHHLENVNCILKHSGENGVCRNVRDCPEVDRLYAQGIPDTPCSLRNVRDVAVCCPIVKSKRISEKKCDEFKSKVQKTSRVTGLSLIPVFQDLSSHVCEVSTGLIVGGVETKIGEFPHMAALGRRTRDGGNDFFCSGSLISEYFVLTAAHCKTGEERNIFARLGDQNIKSKEDGLDEVDYAIIRIIKHENYSKDTRQNDIAVAELSKKVAFTKYIRPACLWQDQTSNHKSLTATGWGRTEYLGPHSDTLMKVQISIQDISRCVSIFEEFVVDDKQICSDGSGRDTCERDSGGPIQMLASDNKCIAYIVGVTSYGGVCGITDTLSVYAKVSAYLDWIESKVWGNDKKN